MISIILEHVCISDLSDKYDRLPELENQIRDIDLADNSWQAILNLMETLVHLILILRALERDISDLRNEIRILKKCCK